MTAARVLVPLALLVVLWYAVDVPAALARVVDVEPAWLVGGLLLVQLQVVLSAFRWRLTAARLGQRIGATRAIGEYYLATLLNQVLPGGVAGDAARVFRVADRRSVGGGSPGGGGDGGRGAVVGGGRGADVSRTVSTAGAAKGVVVERLAGQLALVAVTVAGLLVWPFAFGTSPPRAALVALGSLGTLALGGVAVVVALGRWGPLRWRRFATGIAPLLRRCWLEDGVWFAQGASSLAIAASYVALFALAAAAVGAPLPPGALGTVVPLTLASMLLPFSVGGWGLREGAAAALWPLVGLSAEAGVAASVLYGLLALGGSVPGLLVLLSVPAGRARRA